MEPTELSTLFMREAHRSIGQTRKDGVRPYEVHPTGVRRRTAQVTVDPRILAIADLHDVEEDVAPKHSIIIAELQQTFGLPPRQNGLPWEYNLEAIHATFGAFIGTGVDFLSDKFTKEAHPDKNRKVRKQLERERYATFPAHIKWVKLADIAENLADDGEVLLADGGAEVGFNQMFIWEKSLCLPYLREKGNRENELLFAQADEILRAQAEKFNVKLRK